MVFRKSRFRWIRFHIEISAISGPKFTGLFSLWWCTWQILNVFIRSGDISHQSLKSTEIGPNFTCFWYLIFFGEGGPLKIVNWDYKIEHNSEHRAKFRGNRPTEHEDLATGKKIKTPGRTNKTIAISSNRDVITCTVFVSDSVENIAVCEPSHDDAFTDRDCWRIRLHSLISSTRPRALSSEIFSLTSHQPLNQVQGGRSPAWKSSCQSPQTTSYSRMYVLQ